MSKYTVTCSGCGSEGWTRDDPVKLNCPYCRKKYLRVKPIFAWYDFWIGWYWNQEEKELYIFPVPCFGFVIYKEDL